MVETPPGWQLGWVPGDETSLLGRVSGRRSLDDKVWIDRAMECGLLENVPLTVDVMQPKKPKEPPLPVIVFIDSTPNGPTKDNVRLIAMAAGGDYVCVKVNRTTVVNFAARVLRSPRRDRMGGETCRRVWD